MKEEQAYKNIKNMIVQGRFTMQESISINELAAQMNMSRTPVHKALAQLEREGYITITPQVGVFVRRPDQKEIFDRLQLCVAIDVFLAEQAARSVSEFQLEELKEVLERMENPSLAADKYEALNVQFHTVICKAANNDFAFRSNKINWDYLNYVNISEELFQGGNREQSQAEHRMIYYALKDRDTKLTELLVRKHLMRVAQFITEKYKQVNV
ncbi:GntR family transcriptional regulator [Planococcus sp. 1R117A]|uniref:GntR family transcriptional regulator n=1 Tax=Planococcus shenhongbingii TaxID=3058398 RepID=A0ABT8NGN8_9BACL|nr:GntR family transcriptional regulator [Planococcus sp. N017]MDN7247066.1 GntR family transcriptional regulator [Planococcus sp. N017]